RRGGPGDVPPLLRPALPQLDQPAQEPDPDRLVPDHRDLQPGLLPRRGHPLATRDRLGRAGARALLRRRARGAGRRPGGRQRGAAHEAGENVSSRTRSIIGAVAWRTLHRMYTNPSLLLPSLIFPLFFFTAFAGGLSAISNVPGFNFSAG